MIKAATAATAAAAVAAMVALVLAPVVDGAGAMVLGAGEEVMTMPK